MNGFKKHFREFWKKNSIKALELIPIETTEKSFTKA